MARQLPRHVFLTQNYDRIKMNQTLHVHCMQCCATIRAIEVVIVAKSNSKLYTMQEMADALGVNKTSVYRFLKKESIAPATIKSNTNFYSATTMQRLKKHFKSPDSKSKGVGASRDVLVATLQQQVESLQSALAEEKSRNDKALDAKDKQIEELNNRLRESHQLQLGLQKKLEMLPEPKENVVYEANSADDTVDNKVDETPAKDQPKGFWSRLFGR